MNIYVNNENMQSILNICNKRKTNHILAITKTLPSLVNYYFAKAHINQKNLQYQTKRTLN